MTLLRLRPMLSTDKLEETIVFYTSKLGFEPVNIDMEIGWASLHRDHVEIMLSKPNAHRPFAGPVYTGSFYINTNDVDALWESLKNEVAVVYEIESFGYGMREFAIYDNNGYILQFGQPMETIVH